MGVLVGLVGGDDESEGLMMMRGRGERT